MKKCLKNNFSGITLVRRANEKVLAQVTSLTIMANLLKGRGAKLWV